MERQHGQYDRDRRRRRLNTSSLNWFNGSSGADQAWNNSNNDTALFGVAPPASNAYTVSVGTAVTVGGIAFQNQAYTISGNAITLGGARPRSPSMPAAARLAQVWPVRRG